MTVPVPDGGLALYSAAGDAFAGRRLGFGRRRAAVAANFARARGSSGEGIVANWVAGALAEIGLAAVALGEHAAWQERLLALAAAPLHGAHIVASIPGLPSRAADIVRWHREHDDGTGVPDGLRWETIPADAAALGIVHAFLETLEGGDADTAEALFSVANDCGRRFGIERVRAFRRFVLGTTGWDEPAEVELPALNEDALLVALAARLDARDPSGEGRSLRIAAIAGPLAERMRLERSAAERAANLLALGNATHEPPGEPYDPLSRFARDRRRGAALRAAAIAASVPRYAADASVLGASADWYEDGAREPLAGVLALAVAASALPVADAPRRLAAAAGTQFDPVVTDAYLAGVDAQ